MLSKLPEDSISQDTRTILMPHRVGSWAMAWLRGLAPLVLCLSILEMSWADLGAPILSDDFLAQDTKAYYERLVVELDVLAGQGYPEACLELADKLIRGDSIPKDTDRAIYYLRKPEAFETIDARFRLASLYRRLGQYDEAFSLYEGLSTDRRRPLLPDEQIPYKSSIALAAMYKNGEGVARDLTKALSIYRNPTIVSHCSLFGPGTDPAGGTSSGDIYSKSRRFVADYDRLRDGIVQKLADQGSATASFEYADNLWFWIVFRISGPPPAGMNSNEPEPPRKDRSGGLDAEEIELLKYYTYAAERGHLGAQLGLGHACRVMKEWKCAIQWYERAASSGSIKAMLELADMYDGWRWRGAPIDKQKSLDYLRQASDTQDPDALYRYGMKYLSGESVPEDPGKAIELLQKAAANGSEAACEELARRYSDGDQIAMNKTRALINRIRLFELNLSGEDSLAEHGLEYTPFTSDSTYIAKTGGLGSYAVKNLLIDKDGSRLNFTCDLLTKDRPSIETLSTGDFIALDPEKPFFVVGQMRSDVFGVNMLQISLDGEEQTWWIPAVKVTELQR